MEPGSAALVGNVSEDGAASPFSSAVRGYDRRQVDEYVTELENRARQVRERAGAVGRDLAQARRRLAEQERPSYAGLGSGIGQLLRLAEEQATELVHEARSAAEEVKAAARLDAAGIRAAAEDEAAGLRAAAKRETGELRGAAEAEAEAITAAGRREADELTSAAGREAARLRATAEHEIAEVRAATEADLAQVRSAAEREAAQLKASATRERDTILTTSKRQADEMRGRAQRTLEDSEAQRAQADAKFDIALASRREEAARQEAERLASAQAVTQRLVSEAEQRAAVAEQRTAKASAQADQARRQAEQHAQQAVSGATGDAGRLTAQATEQAQRRLAEAKAEAERYRAALQHEIEELTQRKDAMASHLAQVRGLFGPQLPSAGEPPAETAQTAVLGGQALPSAPYPVSYSGSAVPGGGPPSHGFRATPPRKVAVRGPRSGPSPCQLLTGTTPGGTSSRPSKKPRISSSEWTYIRPAVYAEVNFSASAGLPTPTEMMT